MQQQENKKNNGCKVDYSYIKYFQKAYVNATDSDRKEYFLRILKSAEAERDYYHGTIRQIKHLIQIDTEPNHDLREPRWEIYKITLSFRYGGSYFMIPSKKQKFLEI